MQNNGSTPVGSPPADISAITMASTVYAFPSPTPPPGAGQLQQIAPRVTRSVAPLPTGIGIVQHHQGAGNGGAVTTTTSAVRTSRTSLTGNPSARIVRLPNTSSASSSSSVSSTGGGGAVTTTTTVTTVPVSVPKRDSTAAKVSDVVVQNNNRTPDTSGPQHGGPQHGPLATSAEIRPRQPILIVPAGGHRRPPSQQPLGQQEGLVFKKSG